MVYNGNPYRNGWFGGTPIFGNTHIWVASSQQMTRVFLQCSIEVMLGLSAHPLLFNSRRLRTVLRILYFPYISILLSIEPRKKKKHNPCFPPIIAVFFFPGSLRHGLWNKPQLGSISSSTKNTLNHQAFSSLFTSPTRWAPTYDRYKVINYTPPKTNMSPKKGLFQ